MARPGKRETIKSQLIEASSALKAVRIRDGWLDAEVLLAHVLQRERPWLHAHPERPLTAAQRRRFRDLVARRSTHVPVAYLTGQKEFFGHRIRVTPAVLIPRPDTELLVELAISWLRRHPQARRVIDVGTGSGAIAIAIAKGVPTVRVIAVDVEAGAVRVAAANVVEHRLVSRVAVRRGDVLAGAPAADLIAANLPYLSAARRRSGGPELAHEPDRALNGGSDGLDLIRRALVQAQVVLRSGGCLLFECDPPQARPIGELAMRTWPSARVSVHKDLAGHDRVVQIEV
jgi:release factor glutamine methyltransferase